MTRLTVLSEIIQWGLNFSFSSLPAISGCNDLGLLSSCGGRASD